MQSDGYYYHDRQALGQNCKTYTWIHSVKLDLFRVYVPQKLSGAHNSVGEGHGCVGAMFSALMLWILIKSQDPKNGMQR
jgi:hypothetical protein